MRRKIGKDYLNKIAERMKGTGRTRLFHALMIAALLIGISLASSTLAYLVRGTGAVTNVFAAAPKYTLTYYENTTDTVTDMPSPKSDIVSYSGKFNISDALPKRAGYRFLNWNTKDDNTGTKVNRSQSAFQGNGYHTDLYAIWEQDKYQLTYDPNGGIIEGATDNLYKDVADDTAATHTFNIKSNAELGLSHSNTAKVFMGWAESPNAKLPEYGYDKKGFDSTGKELNNLNDSVTLTSSNKKKVLYAVWGNLYILRFDPNTEMLGGKWGDDAEPLTEMRAMSPDPSFKFHIPAKTDAPKNYPETDNNLYHFAWWATAPDKYDDIYESEYKYDQDVTLYIDGTGTNGKLPAQQTLYAVYQTSAPAQLIYVSNEPETAGNAKANFIPASWAGSSQERYITKQIPYGYRTYKPELTNHIFLGYSTDPSSRDPEYQIGDWVRILNAENNNTLTLYAIWRPKHTFRVHFHYNNTKVSGTTDGVYRLNNGVWEKASDSTNFYVGSTRYSSDATYSTGLTEDQSKKWDQAFWNENGLYATKATTDIDEWEFLGWSTQRNATTAEYEVDDNGHLIGDIEIECTEADCAGVNHDVVLWGVWKRTPLHTFRLVFAPNYGEDTVANRNTGSNVGFGSRTITSIKKNKNGGPISIHSWRYDIYVHGPVPITTDKRIWTAEELRADGPLATKADTTTATFKLLGWSYEPRSKTVDVPVDANGYITEDIEVYEPHTGDDACDGEIHNLLLFPVWQSIPLHTYNVIFATGDTTTNLMAYDSGTEQWVTNKSTSGSTFVSNGTQVDMNGKTQTVGRNNQFRSGNQTADVTSYTVNGPFRFKCERNSTNTEEWEFLGWTETKGKETPDYLVNDDGYLTDLSGNMINSLTIDEHDDTRGACIGKTAGVAHNRILFPVFKKTTRNTFRLMFATDYTYARVHYDMGEGPKTADNTYTGNKTAIMPDGSDYNAGRTDNVLLLEGGTYIASEKNSYTWNSTGWTMTASRDSATNKRYNFKGWSYRPDRSTIDIPVDTNGKIQQDITLTVPERFGENGGVFYTVLWAVFEEETVHHYNLYLSRNFGGNYDDGRVWFKKDNGTWTYAWDAHDRISMVDGTVEQDRIWGKKITSGEVSSTVDHYTWSKDDFWASFGAYATRDATVNYKYKFLGWAYDKTSTVPDIPVELDENGRGYITQDVTINEPSTGDCTGGNHNMALYAVWQAIPNTRTYEIKYGGKGSGKPQDLKFTETYDEENGWAAEQTLDVGTEIPTNQKLAFMGWSTSDKAIIPSYGHPNPQTNELYDLTSSFNLSPTYTIPAPAGNSVSVTLYPVWWYAFELEYDANGGTGGPASTHGYGATNTFDFDVKPSSKNPTRDGYTFLGWADSSTATEPQYFAPEEGQELTDENRVKGVRAGGDGSVVKKIYAVWEEDT